MNYQVRTGFRLFEKIFSFYFNKGLESAKNNNISLALDSLTKALSYNPYSTDALNLTGLCLYRLGRFKNAEFYWLRSIEIDSTSNQALSYLGDLKKSMENLESEYSVVMDLLEKKNYRKALGLFDEKVYAKFSKSVDILNFLGILNLLSGNNRQAIKIWKEVLIIDTMNYDALSYLTVVKEDRLSELKFKIKNFVSGITKHG